MAGFDPSKFLAETAPSEAAFDPGKFLAETTPKEKSTGEKVVRGALNSLPYLGAVAGAALGTPADIVTGPVGTIAGAGLGMAAGKSLQNIGEKYLLHDYKSREDVWKDPLVAAKDGVMFEMGGQTVGAIPGLIKSGANSAKNMIANKLGMSGEFTPAVNKDAIELAAKSLGIKQVPKAVLTDNPTFQKLESGLSQSGSIPAKSVRDEYNTFFKGVDQASKKIAALKTADSDFKLGAEIQQGLTKEVQDLKTPVSEMYKSISPDLKNIEVNKSVVNRVFGDLKRNPMFQTKDGKQLLEEYKAATLSQPDLASLKEFRSTLGKSVGPSAAPIDASRMDALQSAVTSIRNNSVEAMKTTLPKNMHPEVDDLISQISLADAAHSTNVKDLNSIKSLVGNKEVGSPSGFLNKLNAVKESDLAERAANLDVSTLRNMKDKFPQIFDKVKEAKINNMIQRSTSPVNGFDETRFLKQYEGLDTELRSLVFDQDMQKHIESLKTLKQAIPDKLGPSGTPEGKMMMDMFNPKRIGLDYGIKKTLQSATEEVPAAAQAAMPKNIIPLKKASPITQAFAPRANQATNVVNFPRAADNQIESLEKPKGKEKWANDGFEKLIQHTDDSAILEQLNKNKDAIMSDPKIKDLLIQASDLKPGSKSMEAVMSKIKNRVGQN